MKLRILVTSRVRNIGLQVKDATLTYPQKVLSLKDIGGKRAWIGGNISTISWIGRNISTINRIHESCACQDYK